MFSKQSNFIFKSKFSCKSFRERIFVSKIYEIFILQLNKVQSKNIFPGFIIFFESKVFFMFENMIEVCESIIFDNVADGLYRHHYIKVFNTLWLSILRRF